MKLIVLLVLLGIAVAQGCFNCATQCGTNGKCLGCDNGFSLDNIGGCSRYTPIEDCKIYDASTGGCFQCYPGSILQYGICQQLIPNCNFTITNNTQVCTSCNQSYVLVDDIHCYSSNILNCPMGSLPRRLPSTNQGYCQKFELQKCLTPSDDISYCKVCYNEYFNLNGVCTNLTNQIPCPDNTCQCQYYYKDGICYQFDIDGCILSKDKLYCDLCNDTLVAVSGRCFEPVKISDIHCNVLELNRDICTGCNFNYLLDPNNICVKRFNLCSDPKRSCEAQCSHSSLLYYNGECYIRDPQCIAYDITNYRCTKCFEGFVLNLTSFKCEKQQKCWISNGKTCQKCFTGYQLNPNTYLCDKLPYNCRQMSLTGVCQTCSSFTELISQQIPQTQVYGANFSLAINTSICVYTTPNCQYYNIYGFCQICKVNFVQRKRQCIPVATNCWQPDTVDKSKCQKCNVGYELDPASLTCYPRIEGCQTYGATKNCARCREGYVLRNGLCMYKDANCLQFNANGNCMRCGNSLVPYYNQCVFYDPYCYMYDRNGFCSASFGGFFKSVEFSSSLQTNYRSFIASVRNIAASSSSSSSSSSQSQNAEILAYGGYFTTQGWIRVLPTVGLYNEKISQYDLNGKIRSCREGYTLLNDNCILRTDYCAEYSSSNGVCLRCLPFYHLGLGRKCVSTSPAICSIPTSTGEYCSKCAPEYVLINGQCYFRKLNVIEYSSSDSTVITSVEAGYFVWEKYQIAYPKDENCVSQNQPGNCRQCLQQSEFTQSGMRNIEGKCILIKQNCAKYSVRGLCNSCINGYFLYYGQCYPNNCLTATNEACLTCPYLFNYEAGLCVNKIQSNCLVYDQIIGFNATLTKAIACRFCAAGFYLKTDSTCQRMISNCEVTDSQSGRCVQCIPEYKLYEDQCIKEISGCLIYNRASNYLTCTQCNANYNLTNNQCFSLPPRCIQLNSSGSCSKCQTGYNPIIQNGESICIFTVANCILYSRQGRCNQCAKNYVLQNNLCNFNLPGCQQINNGTCLKCLPGYYLRNGFCILDQYCISVQNGQCTKCLQGYTLQPNGICKKNIIDNCITEKDGDCLECYAGYLKIKLYGQTYCILKRIIYSGCATEQYPCPKCQAGFQLKDDGLCYAKYCKLPQTLSRFSLRTCSACYPYYKLDPTNRFCILYNCNSPACYQSTVVPPGFRQSTRKDFLIEILYCRELFQDYSCKTCENYRYPNLYVQWNLCYPNNCRVQQLYNCSGNCYNYFNNNIPTDNSLCTADNCQQYNPNGTCLICNKPYNVVNGICLYQGPCLDYNPSTGQCRSCLEAYNLVSGSCIAKNCTSYSPSDVSICLQCAKGYQLTSNRTCQLKYCQYPNQNYPCPQCLNGYFFNPVTNLCHMLNCNYFDYTTNRCLQCQPTYKLTPQGYCIPDQCADFSVTSWKCLTCTTGYKLNINGQCVIDNCCGFSGVVCTQCCSGFDYVQGLCRDRCVSYSIPKVCTRCRQGYTLNSNSQCVTQISGCVTFSGSTCTQCRSGLMLYNGICVPRYCNSYTQANPTRCLQCHPRFTLMPQGLCYPKNCVNFNSSSWSCLQCQSTATYRYSLVSNTSICFTQKCSRYLPSDYICQQCQSTQTAQYKLQVINGSQVCVLECGLYYELANSQCRLKYCSNYYPNNKCATCAPGYQLQPLTGYCKLKFCLNYNLQSCLTCRTGFVLDPINKKYCVPASCENYNIGSEQCLKCQEGYVLEYNLCVLRDCISFNNQYICQKCLQGFNLTVVNNTLICQKTYPSNCADGYFFSPSRGSCQPIPVDYCRYVNPLNSSYCLSCFPGYFLFQGQCYSIDGCQQWMFSYIYGCKQCIKGFKLNGNICVKDLCEEYAVDGNCKTCTQGYFLLNGNCIPYTNFCIYGNVYQGCVNCQTGYQPVNGVCRKLPEFCAYINPTLDCIQCIQGYVLNNGVCYLAIPNCLNQRGYFCDKCDTLYIISGDQRSCISKQPIRYCQRHDSTYQYCLYCLQGFALTSDKKCIAEHCSKYDLATLVCTQCANQTVNGVAQFYSLREDKCISISISFCSIPFNETTCKQCIQGFNLINGFCRALNCQVYKDNQQQCSTCLQGYYLVGNLCRKYPDNCQVVSGTGICTVCLTGYTLNSQGQCVKGTDFCQRYNQDGLCLKCATGYYLTANKVCSRLSDNCLDANAFGQCLQCVSPYILSSSGVCYRLINNCARYNELGGCVSCSNGFFLAANGFCQALPDFCLSATTTGQCRQCIPNYRLQNGLCIKQVPNCASYTNNACTSCQASYYLITGLCYKLPPNCIIPNQQSQCLRCEYGYTLYRGFCYLTIQNCLGYGPLSDCTQCADGFYVNSQGKCSQTPTNCGRVNINGICLQCAKGFVLDNGVCYRLVSNCFSYNSVTNLCRQCVSGYYLIQGKCYRLSENCLAVNTLQTCITCVTGYTLQNNICYLTLPFCQVYQSNTVCSKCVQGYYLTLNGQCTTLPQGCSQASNQQCFSCISGYILQNGICYKQYPNCNIYDPVSRQCQQCSSSYFLLNGICYQLPDNCMQINSQRQCVSCANGFALQGGICYRLIENCLSYSGGVCIQCRQGYYVSFGACILLPLNCLDVSQNGACLKCSDGFFLQNGICYRYDKYCNGYNTTTYICRSCIQGYYLNYQFTCQPVPLNCLSTNIYGNCTGCKTNYQLVNGLCYPSIPQCDNWNLTTMLCQKCISGFFLRDGYCYRTVENCEVYSPTNFNCIKCIVNYILSNNVCITCGDGFYVDNYGQCRPNPINCKVSNQYGQCLQCQPSFTLIGGQCTQQVLYCQNYSTNSLGQNICTQCYVGYYMKDPFTCLRLPNGCAAANSKGFCLQCNQGYAVNANGICYTVIAYCQSYQLATGLCLQCIQNYYLNINQTCTPILQNNCLFANSLGQCIQCVQGYVLVNSVCYVSIPYCFNHSSASYTCLQCLQGYYLSSNNKTCYKIPNGCLNMRNDQCLTCMQGYQLINGLCNLIDDTTCIRYQLLSSVCLQCKAGYYLTSNNICFRVPQYCVQANSQGQCLSCITGYVLNNGVCVKEIPNCLRWGPGTCLQCADQYYLQNGLCYKSPDYCFTFDSFTLQCLKCIAGYDLSMGRCILNQSTNCLYYNPLQSSQCYTCKNTFYETWVNTNTGQVITAVMTVENFCRPYPEYCTNVDLLGNCISCCFASRLDSTGRCVGTTLRSLNCDLFDAINMKCLKCMVGYSYCQWLAICIQVNLNCLSYNSLRQCTQCADGFLLVNGQCAKPAPGVSSTTGGVVCKSGYTYSTVTEYGNSAGSCFRNKNQLIKISSIGQVFKTSYRPDRAYATSAPQRINQTIWSPPSYLNNYISITTSKPQIIHYIQVQGTSLGYVSHYLIQFRNKENAPFICWNSCQKVRANINGNDIAELKLVHPIVATEIRIYPVKWVGGIYMSLQMLVENQ